MRLSDAIALGRVLIEKPDGSSYCSCALGMANAAIEGKELEGAADSFYSAYARWPFISKRVAHIEYSSKSERSIEQIISKWFIDTRLSGTGKTLDGLIDWVRSVEPFEEISVDMTTQEEVEFSSIT
jgi:hypothetical protein